MLRQLPVAQPRGLYRLGRQKEEEEKVCVGGRGAGGCGGVGVGKPTGLQVQTEVEERAVSERAQQVVAAFEGGH